jgi:hypothetical protein
MKEESRPFYGGELSTLLHHSTLSIFLARSDSCLFPAVNSGRATPYFFSLQLFFFKLLALVQSLFSTNLTNRGIPFDLFIGWSVLNPPWFTNQKNIANQKQIALAFGFI